MNVLVLIPARYESSRFPGKPLAKIGGEEMIVRVCKRVSLTGFDLAVATDYDQIAECVQSHGYNAIMTRADHQSGTDRIAEAYRKYGKPVDVIINVQGDEPFIHPDQLNLIASIFEREPDTQIATLASPFQSEEGISRLEDPNLVKLVKNDNNEAIYFSRSVIPYLRNRKKEEWPALHQYFTHIGIYAYRPSVLLEIVDLPRTSLEIAESLEQLRWLQNGFVIKIAETYYKTIGIDTTQDLQLAEEQLKILGL